MFYIYEVETGIIRHVDKGKPIFYNGKYYSDEQFVFQLGDDDTTELAVKEFNLGDIPDDFKQIAVEGKYSVSLETADIAVNEKFVLQDKSSLLTIAMAHR